MRRVTVVLFAGVLLIAGCSGSDEKVATMTTATNGSQHGEFGPATRTVPCAGGQPSTFMTLPPPATSLVFHLSASPRTVRRGGMVKFSIRISNPGASAVAVNPSIVVTDVLPHVVVCGLTLLRVPAHGTKRVDSYAALASLPIGEHTAFVREGQSNSASVTVRPA